MKDYRNDGIGQSPEMNYIDEKAAAAGARDAALNTFLNSTRARCMWAQHVAMVGTVSAYTVDARLFVVMRYKDRAGAVTGWDVYTPCNTTGKIDATLDALRAYIKGGE